MALLNIYQRGLVVAVMIAIAPGVVDAASWAESEIADLTTKIQLEAPEWKLDDTRKLLLDANTAAEVHNTYFKPPAPPLVFQITGKTVLLNGRDLTGHLGSKSTYGDNSPIVGDVVGGQVTTGPQSPVVTKNYTLYLSIPLAFSLIGNAYLTWKVRRLNAQLRVTRDS